jgi:hypothetical protein
MALTILQLVKYLPMTNCGECGYATCMAFASHVVKKKESLELCSHLAPEVFRKLHSEIQAQHAKNENVAPDRFKNVKDFVVGKIQCFDFAELAPYLGGTYLCKNGKDIIMLPYLGRSYEISKEDAAVPDTKEDRDVWDIILLYNYIASNCRETPTGKWVSIDALPGSIPKKPELEETCEKRIAQAFKGDTEGLKAAIRMLEGVPAELETSADLKALLHPLPKTPFLLLFWDEDGDEGFEARVKVLFDETILCFLDIESMVFLAEKMANRLVEVKKGKGRIIS